MTRYAILFRLDHIIFYIWWLVLYFLSCFWFKCKVLVLMVLINAGFFAQEKSIIFIKNIRITTTFYRLMSNVNCHEIPILYTIVLLNQLFSASLTKFCFVTSLNLFLCDLDSTGWTNSALQWNVNSIRLLKYVNDPNKLITNFSYKITNIYMLSAYLCLT